MSTSLHHRLYKSILTDGGASDVSLTLGEAEASSALRVSMETVLRTRQSMNVLLQALERDGYATRPAEARVGKVLPARLTSPGRRNLEKASVAVRSVEDRMLGGLTKEEQSSAFRILQSMIRSLGDEGGLQR